MHQIQHVGSKRAVSTHGWWDDGPKPTLGVDTVPLREEEKNILDNDTLVMVSESQLPTNFSLVRNKAM